MLIFKDIEGMRAWSRQQRADNRSIGFVPTMGSLHIGHMSLVTKAASLCDCVVVSIYVNPSQFGANEDFDVYPRNVDSDLQKLEEVGVHAVFTPTTLYPASRASVSSKGNATVSDTALPPGQHETFVHCENLEKVLCGISRPHFFSGVATVVTKLLNIVQPDVAVFGRKDYQQWRIITTVARELNFPVEIVGAEILREPDGLACSSRNAMLTPDSRKAAPCIYASLTQALGAWQGGLRDVREFVALVEGKIREEGGKIDYVQVVDAESLQALQVLSDQAAIIAVAAAFQGKSGMVRLIDNVELPAQVTSCEGEKGFDGHDRAALGPTIG